jgi:Na+/H+-dicarboxylate symporter
MPGLQTCGVLIQHIGMILLFLVLEFGGHATLGIRMRLVPTGIFSLVLGIVGDVRWVTQVLKWSKIDSIRSIHLTHVLYHFVQFSRAVTCDPKIRTLDFVNGLGELRHSENFV